MLTKACLRYQEQVRTKCKCRSATRRDPHVAWTLDALTVDRGKTPGVQMPKVKCDFRVCDGIE